MRIMTLRTFNAVPREWKKYRAGRCYLMLAGKFRHVWIITALGPEEQVGVKPTATKSAGGHASLQHTGV